MTPNACFPQAQITSADLLDLLFMHYSVYLIPILQLITANCYLYISVQDELMREWMWSSGLARWT
jgi:cell division inhibitor SulA